MTIVATGMSYDKLELHYAKTTMYHEFEPEGENIILPFNSNIMKRDLEEDG